MAIPILKLKPLYQEQPQYNGNVSLPKLVVPPIKKQAPPVAPIVPEMKLKPYFQNPIAPNDKGLSPRRIIDKYSTVAKDFSIPQKQRNELIKQGQKSLNDIARQSSTLKWARPKINGNPTDMDIVDAMKLRGDLQNQSVGGAGVLSAFNGASFGTAKKPLFASADIKQRQKELFETSQKAQPVASTVGSFVGEGIKYASTAKLIETIPFVGKAASAAGKGVSKLTKGKLSTDLVTRLVAGRAVDLPVDIISAAQNTDNLTDFAKDLGLNTAFGLGADIGLETLGNLFKMAKNIPSKIGEKKLDSYIKQNGTLDVRELGMNPVKEGTKFQELPKLDLSKVNSYRSDVILPKPLNMPTSRVDLPMMPRANSTYDLPKMDIPKKTPLLGLPSPRMYADDKGVITNGLPLNRTVNDTVVDRVERFGKDILADDYESHTYSAMSDEDVVTANEIIKAAKNSNLSPIDFVGTISKNSEAAVNESIDNLAAELSGYKGKGASIVPILEDYGGSRTGYRVSNNDEWYKNFYAQNGRAPYKNEFRGIADSLIQEDIKRGGGRYIDENLAKDYSYMQGLKSTVSRMGDNAINLTNDYDGTVIERGRFKKEIEPHYSPVNARQVASLPLQKNSATNTVVANLSKSQKPIIDDAGLPQKIKASINTLNAIQPVSTLSGKEFAKGEKKLTEQVGDFFRSFGNKVSRSGFGDVVLDENGVSDSIAHGLGRKKSVTFAAVPDIIKYGKQIDVQENWKNRNYDTYVFAAPVTIENDLCYVAAVVTKKKDSNRYYLHEVVDNNGDVFYKKNNGAVNSFKTGLIAENSSTSELTTPVTNPIIPQGNNSVNTHSMQDSGKNAVLQSTAKTTQEQPEDIAKVAEVLTKTPKPNIPTLKQVDNLIDAFSRKFVDSGNTINKVARISKDPTLYHLYNNAKQARQTAESFLTLGQSDFKGERVGDSLSEVFEPIRKKGDDYYKSFSEYLFHMHNVDRMAQGKPVFGESVTADVSSKKTAELLKNNPEFQKLSERVYEYNRNLMQYRVDSGLVSKEQADLMNEMYPHYVPTFRDVSGISGSQADRNAVKIASTIKRATGSSQNLLPMHESMARQTMQTVQAAKRNVLGLRMLGDAIQNKESVGEYIKEIAYGGDTFDVDNDLFDMPELRNSFHVYDKGKPVQMKINAGIYDGLQAISGMGKEMTWVERVAKSGNNTFKKLVTGYNPMFVVKNFARDLPDAGLYTSNLKDFIKVYPTVAKDMLGNSPLWQQYQALGGFGSSVFDYEKGYNTKALYENKNLLQKGIDKIEQLNFLVEQAPRFTEFKAQIKRGGDEYDNLMKAMYAAADVTVNFGRSGTWGKTLNSTFVPFFNPSVQGFDKMIRQFTQAKGAKEWTSLAIKIAVLGVAPSLINSLLYDDDEEYSEISDRDKDTNYLFKVKDGLWAKIPKGRVVSLFGDAAQRGLRQLKGEENAWAGFIKTALDQTAPISPFTSNIAAPAIAMTTGKTWYGTDIEPQRLKSLRPGLRYDENTDAFSKWLGEKLDYSPKKINYLLDSYTGVIGDFVLPLTTPRAEMNPLMKTFTIDPVMSNKLPSQFYDKLDELAYGKNDAKDAPKYALMHKYFNRQAQAVSDLNKEIRRIETSDSSDSDKRIEVREIKAVINGIQRNAMSGLKTFENKISVTGDEDADYIRANRKAFGAEYALQVYNKAVYEKAIETNVNYDMFLEAYFAQKDIEGDKDSNGKTLPLSASKNKKAAVDAATPGMSSVDRKKLYAAFGVSEKVW